jgi:NADH:ubiquinone oxidoreductase subunit E
MLKKRKIQLCLGSSCFARGNHDLIPLINRYISKKNLGDKVEFTGDHCFSRCSDGPNLYIGMHIFQKVNKFNLEQLLDQELADLLTNRHHI